MRRTQLYLDDQLWSALHARARTQKTTVSALVRQAVRDRYPALLEPIIRVEVQATVEYVGDLMSDMNGRRSRISGIETKGSTQIIRSQTPISEMLDHQNDLISMTQGRASYHMEFDHYDFVPMPQAEKIIAASKAARAGIEEEEE